MSQDSALLDAAVEQFVLTGVRRTSADDIARRAGVNRATLYRRLGTKDQIVAQAILQETGRVLARITEAIGEVPPAGTRASTRRRTCSPSSPSPSARSRTTGCSSSSCSRTARTRWWVSPPAPAR